MTGRKIRPSWAGSFLAVVRYELLWNIRKKKVLGVLILAFAIATITLVLPVVLNNLNNLPTEPNPDYVINTGTIISGVFMFIFALVTVMNSISGEFESGSIVPLITKPVSRTTVYLGKISSAILTLLGAYVLLTVYIALGGSIIYGPQNNLHLLSVSLLGSILSTLLWMAIVLAMGSVSKSSMLAGLAGVGIYFGLNIAAGILSLFSNQAWILTYAPGSGASGYIKGLTPINPQTGTPIGGVSTGTDSIAGTLITYILHPASEVTFYRLEYLLGSQRLNPVDLYTEPLSLVVARSIAVAVVYILVFNFIAWYAFKRAQVAE